VLDSVWMAHPGERDHGVFAQQVVKDDKEPVWETCEPWPQLEQVQALGEKQTRDSCDCHREAGGGEGGKAHHGTVH
jgi:hypothetical protein